MTATAPAQHVPAAPDLPGPAPEDGVRIAADGLRITRLVVADPDVIAGARVCRDAGGSLDGWAASALSVGAKAIALAGGAVAVDGVAGRIDALARAVAVSAEASAAKVEAAVRTAADERDGTVAVAVRDALARLRADVDALIAGEDAPLRAAIARSLHDATGQAAGRVERALAANADQVRAVLSPSDPAGPLAALRHDVERAAEQTRRELGDQLGEVRTLLAVARERAAGIERSSAKGVRYEEAVVDACTEIARGAGDTVEATGTGAGATGPHAKSGDAVAVVDPAATGGAHVKIVVEAKDAKLSSARWHAELLAGRRNRGAAAGLGVVRSPDRMPGGRRRVFVLDPCNVVVAWDPADGVDDVLAAAYCLVRAGAVQAALAAGGDRAETAALDQAVRDAYDALNGFDALDRAAGAARRGVEDVTAASQALRAQLHGHLARGLRAAGPSR